ncbi:MAG: Ca2+-binding EF-hand superfamily protein [Paraglaciecola sp.]|jgi:Ca2+-binding EF-hand superfamily protein
MKKLSHPKGVLLLSMLTTLCLFSSAQAFEDTMQRLDRNADGQISIKEAVADPRVLESFSSIDTDGNGIISAPELASKRYREARARSKS